MGNKEDRISVDRLKAAHVDDSMPVTVAQPPRRGRPPSRPLPVPPNRSAIPPQQAQERPPDPAPIRPTYAEVTTRSGRTTRPPNRFQS
jgi:hypothetical protein